MTCPQCNTPLPTGSRFCPGCGQQFSEPVPAQNAYTAPAQSKPVKSFSWIRVLVVLPVVLILMVFFAYISNPTSNHVTDSSSGSNNPVMSAISTSHTVTYKIKGSASSVDVTYNNAQGGSQQIGNASVPWSQTFTADSGSFLYLSAQNKGESGTVETEIDVDGKPRKQSQSSGGYTIADVHDTL